ncbi:MAG: M1 family metallopeptidase [Anaerolineae bacterium]|nr:M1 family metallopeptidase [Anaerolineae bacterium]
MNASLCSLLLLALVIGCLPSAPPATIAPPAPTATAVFIQTTSATPATTLPHSPTTAPEPTGGIERCPLVENGPTITYVIRAELDYALKHLVAHQRVTFRNPEDAPLDQLVFYVMPNREPGLFHLESIAIPGQTGASAVTLEGVRLTISLPTLLQPGCRVVLNLDYTLDIPRMGVGPFARQGYLGFSDQQLNLALWFPAVAARAGRQWITPVPVTVGEQTVLPAADFDLCLAVENLPPTLTVVGPGTARHESCGWRYQLTGAREIALSLGDNYRQITAPALDGAVLVELYTFASTSAEAAEQALHTAVAALNLFADLYGPYPHDRLIILESDFPDGMEFSGLVYVGSEWFRSYRGDPASYLTLITAHEVAHQWWYHRVGNDQSSHPWLDEALATYSEYVFLQESYPDLVDWWWDFRVNSFHPTGFVDSTVYEFQTARDYINAVYLRGAQLLHALRQEIGTEAFFAWLQTYAASMSGQIAAPANFWATLEPDLFDRTVETRRAFLRHSQPDVP